MPSPPAHGALGLTFTVMRVMQAISLITIIGLAGNFINEAVSAGYVAPSPLVGTLVVTCLASIYVVISYILYLDNMLPLLIAAGTDLGILVAVIVVAVVVGKPVSYLTCNNYPSVGNTANFINSVYRNVRYSDGRVFSWADPDMSACYEMKSLWGLSIALCVLFAFSCFSSLAMWHRSKAAARAAAGPKDME